MLRQKNKNLNKKTTSLRKNKENVRLKKKTTNSKLLKNALYSSEPALKKPRTYTIYEKHAYRQSTQPQQDICIKTKPFTTESSIGGTILHTSKKNWISG